MDIFLQQVVNGLTIGSFYALVALGYTMVYGIIRLINFAHGDLFMVGAFAGLALLSGLGGIAGSTSPFVLIPLVFYPTVWFGKRLRKLSRSNQQELGEMANVVNEAFSGNRIAAGTIGVGRTPTEALQDFNRTLQRPLRDGNGEPNGRVALNSAELALLNRKSMMKQFRAADFNRPFKLQRPNKRVNKRRKAL